MPSWLPAGGISPGWIRVKHFSASKSATVPSGRGRGDFSHCVRERCLQKWLKRAVSFLGPKSTVTRGSRLKNKQGLPSSSWGRIPVESLLSTGPWTSADLLKGPGRGCTRKVDRASTFAGVCWHAVPVSNTDKWNKRPFVQSHFQKKDLKCCQVSVTN